ncbi:hypothetical protein LJR230_004763 [Trinickia sp. LjRoot230]|uniref:hypothetical protein n=1 Tax=Trinickia sp. LjRoot230 TaxID=3342288 RepID=UPI003ED1236F
MTEAGEFDRIARGAAGVALVAAYQIAAHEAVRMPGKQALGLALALAPLLLLLVGAAARSGRRGWLLPLVVVSLVGLWTVRASLAQHFQWGLYVEHMTFNLTMAALFGRTLLAGNVPLCSRFAAMVHGTLAPAVARYTRRITAAWALFFLAMAAISTVLFITASIEVWSTFANYLTLPLSAAMFVVEYACRRLVLPDMTHSGLLEGIRAYRQSMQERTALPR